MKLQYCIAALALLLVAAHAQDEGDSLSPGLRKDREGLLALKSKISSPGTSQIENWKASGIPCDFSHVKCSSGNDPRVIEIDLSNRGIVGELAVGLRKAGRLEVINLEGNKFTGSIPNDWAKGNTFTRLRVLNIGNNELSAELPNINRRGAFRDLEELNLSNNKLYGGLPANWLGKYRPLKNVRKLDLSRNLLGTSDGATSYTLLSQWCKTETALGLKAGSGWCPDGTPIENTASSLVSLDLSDNGLVGEVPSKWPNMFPRLQYLKLQFNNLYYLDETQYKVPSALAGNWTTGPQRGFPALSILTLYPGNDYLCSLPDDDGSFQDVNLAATYQVADANGVVYGDGEPRLCPTTFTADIQPDTSSLDLTSADATWDYTIDKPDWIWGFKVTIEVRDKESQEYSPVGNGNGILLRVYTFGQDGGAPAPGLVEAPAGTWTLTFDDMDLNLDGSATSTDKISALDSTNYPTASYDSFRLSVAIIGIDNVENTALVFEKATPL